MNTNEYPPRHIPGFRPLVPGEAWHRTDFTPDMLPEGWRPLLLWEEEQAKTDWVILPDGYVHDVPAPGGAQNTDYHRRTRRPLPPPPTTFEYGGKTWNSHVPGDPCPVDEDTEVYVLYVDGTVGNGAACDFFWEPDKAKLKIGYRIPEADPVNDTAKLRDSTEVATLKATVRRLDDKLADSLKRIAELELLLEDERKKYLARSQHIADLEYDLRTALTPRPIAEAGPVQKGFERVYIKVGRDYVGTTFLRTHDTTHFYDIRLPSPDHRAEYDRAVAKAGGHYEAWLKAKQEGGVA